MDADKFLPVLNAASKVNEVSAIIVIKQKEMKAYMHPNWMQV